MRQALALAVEQGRGREAAVLHNNLALSAWLYEGPKAALAACQEGLDFCERRGIAEFALGIAAMTLTFLAATGQAEQALAEAEPLAVRLESDGPTDFVEVRAVQLRLLVQRGEHRQKAVPDAEAIVARARDSASRRCLDGLRSRCRAAARPGQPSRRRRCSPSSPSLQTSATTPTTPRSCPSSFAPRSRSATRSSPPGFVAGAEARTPLAADASPPAARSSPKPPGDHSEAAELYAEAAPRWRDFGNVPERAYALLGRGRCLVGARQARGGEPLREARELFASMGYEPALAETEALLGESEAAVV